MSATRRKVSWRECSSSAAIARDWISDCSALRCIVSSWAESIEVFSSSCRCWRKKPTTSQRKASGANAPSRKLPSAGAFCDTKPVQPTTFEM